MNTRQTAAHYVSTILGALFILIGVIGFVTPGFLGTHLSNTHNLIHLVSGALALYFGMAASTQGARIFCLTFGTVYGLLGVAGIVAGVPGTPSMAGMPADSHLLRVIPGALELGIRDHLLHVVLGGAFLIAGLMTHTMGMTTRRSAAQSVTSA